MANINKVVENFRETNGLSQGDLAVLLAYKKQLSECINKSPEVLNGRSSADEIMHSNPSKMAAKDPLDYAFLNIVGKYVFDNSEKPALHNQKEMLNGFNKLPQNLQNIIKAQIAIFSDVKSYSEEQKIQQTHTLKFTEDVLGTGEDRPSLGEVPLNKYLESFFHGDEKIDVNGETSRALRDYLESISDTRTFDEDGKKALDEHVKMLAENVGVEQHEINDLITHLYSTDRTKSALFAGASEKDIAQIDALGKAVVMRNLMNMIVEGHTPSSKNAIGHKAETEIHPDKPWSNHFSGDKFFGKGVYKALEREQHTWGKTHLTAEVLFRRRDYTNEQRDILKNAAKKVLGIAPGDDPNREISEMDVGKIAIEIMKVRAKQVWCMEHSGEEFDPKQIHAMIHNKEFMPHLSDLKLVDAGLGVPSEFEPMAKELGVNSFQIQFDFEYPIRMHRMAEFQEMFGDMPEDAIRERAEYHKDKGQFWDNSGKPDMDKLYAYVESNYGTPAYYFGAHGRSSLNMLNQYRLGTDPALGYMTPTPYDLDRQEYLGRVQSIIEDGGCTTGANNHVDDIRMRMFNDAAENTGQTPDDRFNANMKGTCNIFDILKNEGSEKFLIDGDPKNTTVDKDKASTNLNNM